MILTSINKKTQSTNALKFMIQFNGRKYKMKYYQTIQIINYVFIKNLKHSKIGIKKIGGNEICYNLFFYIFHHLYTVGLVKPVSRIQSAFFPSGCSNLHF